MAMTEADIQKRIDELRAESEQYKVDAEKQLYAYAVLLGEYEKMLSSSNSPDNNKEPKEKKNG